MSMLDFKKIFSPEKIIASIFCSVMSLGVFASDVSAENIKVLVDEAYIYQLDRPISQVIIGNPAIADVTLQSRKTLVFTGKSSGHTNIILLDENNQEIMNEKVHVTTSNEKGLVVVHRGRERSSYHCGTICNGRITLGDSPKFSAAVLQATETKLQFARSAAEGKR